MRRTRRSLENALPGGSAHGSSTDGSTGSLGASGARSQAPAQQTERLPFFRQVYARMPARRVGSRALGAGRRGRGSPSKRSGSSVSFPSTPSEKGLSSLRRLRSTVSSSTTARSIAIRPRGACMTATLPRDVVLSHSSRPRLVAACMQSDAVCRACRVFRVFRVCRGYRPGLQAVAGTAGAVGVWAV